MNSVFEIMLRFPPIMDVSIKAASANHRLPIFKEVMHNLQIAFYWLQEADKELRERANSVELVTEEPEEPLPVYTLPTLIGTKAQIEYIRAQLTEIREGTIFSITSTRSVLRC